MNLQPCLLCKSAYTEAILKGEFEITRCLCCQFEYVRDAANFLGQDWFDEYYSRRKNNNSDNLNALREKQYVVDASVIYDYISEGSYILDVGCSNGKFISIISNLKNNLHCFGVDIDGSAIAQANRDFTDIATFEKKGLLAFDGTMKFDLIIFRGTFQYLGSELHDSMRYLKTLLSEGGRIVVFSLPSTDAFMYKLLAEKWALFHPEMNLMFNENSIRALAAQHGYKVKSLTYPYLEDVYSNPIEDYQNIRDIITGLSEKSTPFWGSIMTVVMGR